MRSLIIGATAGLVLGTLSFSVFDDVVPQSSIPYNSDALRSAIADGMSRAGSTIAQAGTGSKGRH